MRVKTTVMMSREEEIYLLLVTLALRPLSKPHRNSIPKSGTIWQSGNCCQNLAQVSGHPCQVFWKSGNLKKNLACVSARSGNDLATIWQQSGINLATKNLKQKHLAQFKKPPSTYSSLLKHFRSVEKHKYYIFIFIVILFVFCNPILLQLFSRRQKIDR